MSIFSRREKDSEFKPRPRLMRWTCRKCERPWVTELCPDPHASSCPVKEDQEFESICDRCLNAMTLETVTC